MGSFFCLSLVISACSLVFLLNGIVAKLSKNDQTGRWVFNGGLATLAAFMLLFELSQIITGEHNALHAELSPASVLMIVSISALFVVLAFICAFNGHSKEKELGSVFALTALTSTAAIIGLLMFIAFPVFFTLGSMLECVMLGVSMLLMVFVDIAFIILGFKSYALFFKPDELANGEG